MQRIVEYKISADNSAKTVKNFLMNNLKCSSRLITNLKMRDGITLNNNSVTVREMLHLGDVLRLVIESDESASQNIIPNFEGLPLDIVYEDPDILVVNKAADVPVHPSKGHLNDTLANYVTAYFAQQNQNFVFRCVNRLDRGTSGLVVIAKNSYTHAWLSDADHRPQKVYTAIVCGIVRDDRGTINAPIGRECDVATIKRTIMDGGQSAVTHYSVEKRFKHHTLVSLTLETGRTHQIRVHMAYIGHPLLGDFLYGIEQKHIIANHALHCEKISLYHPFTGEHLSFVRKRDWEKYINRINRIDL